jgi:hypothetical protein
VAAAVSITISAVAPTATARSAFVLKAQPPRTSSSTAPAASATSASPSSHPNSVGCPVVSHVSDTSMTGGW